VVEAMPRVPRLAGRCTLKTRLYISIPFLVLYGAASVAGQTDSKPVPRTSFLESRQGNHPYGPDVIDHTSVSKGATLHCDMVEVYDETHKASTACVIRIGGGDKYTLTFGQVMRSPQEGELYLECLGDKPRRCRLKVN
jgi:hypothetical protein